mmetsp:Transcript_22059/g.20054  ORF Transcript_22059/g.20054 Transcript_22059/m.20054 type:complete len:471 (-) Transcript_22059:46-1458(-)
MTSNNNEEINVKSNEEYSKSLSKANTEWLNDWDNTTMKLSQEKPKLMIFVQNPEVIGSLMSKYVVYNVRTEPLGYSVKRRYNDFVWLRDILTHRYLGLFIPALPSTTPFSVAKTMMVAGINSKTDVKSNYVRNRMVQLDLFMKQLCKIPFLMGDTALEIFLSCQDEKEFKNTVDSTTKNPNLITKNDGMNLLQVLLDKITIGIESERILFDLRKQLDSLRNTLKQVELQVMNTGKQALAYAKDVELLSQSVIQWNNHEIDLADPIKCECPNTHGGDIKRNLIALVKGNDLWLQNAQIIPKMIATVLLANIQFQLVQVEGFRDFLIMRDNYIKELAKAELAVIKALEDKSKPVTSNQTTFTNYFASKPADKEEFYLKKVEHRDHLQQSINVITKGLLFSEIDRFNKDRSFHVQTLVGSLISANVQIAQKSNSKWLDVANESTINVGDFEENVIAMYTSHDESNAFSDADAV